MIVDFDQDVTLPNSGPIRWGLNWYSLGFQSALAFNPPGAIRRHSIVAFAVQVDCCEQAPPQRCQC